MSASSKVEIMRQALLLSGVGANIESFTESSPEGLAARLWYDTSRRDVLSSFDWGFARRIEPLALSEVAAESEYEYRYSLPNDFLIARKIINPLGVAFPSSESMEEITADGTRTIMTNVEQARLRYTADVQVTSAFPQPVTTAIVFRIASYLAFQHATGKEAQMQQMYELELRKAKTQDGNQDTPPDQLEPDWVRNR